MDIATSKLLLAASGSDSSVYVDDVFQTFLYDGSGSAQTIVNGIDLAGEGGLVIQRRTNVAGNWFLNDTENGANNFLYTNLENPLGIGTSGSSFNSDGFTIGAENNLHANGNKVLSYTFRKAPGFFDIVKYSGTGSPQSISHSLGSVPGMIWIHCLVGTHPWEIFHREVGPGKRMPFTTSVPTNSSTVWNSTDPTASQFTVGTNNNVNQNGHDYVAYIFAHDDQQYGESSSESIIKCGTYEGNSSDNEIDLGFEPQFLLIKNITSARNWVVLDNMRSMSSDFSRQIFLNAINAESSSGQIGAIPTPTGFRYKNLNNINFNRNGHDYIYMAIRRPNKPVNSALDLFSISSFDDTNGGLTSTSVTTDLLLTKDNTLSSHIYVFDRIRGVQGIRTTVNSGGSNFSTQIQINQQTGFYIDGLFTNTSLYYNFRRAPGFFDIVSYQGDNSSSRDINHNLTVKPEIVIVKRTSNVGEWVFGAYVNSITSNLYLNADGANGQGSSGIAQTVNATSSTFRVAAVSGSILSGVNQTGFEYIAYLFASSPGICKIGIFTGTGSDIDVDCGFAAGARFVIIKNRSSAGDWYYWDTVRGINNGNEPYSILNNPAPNTNGYDYIDPLNSGFTVKASSPLNTVGESYLFIAIA